jgi:hypothetical protein
LFESLLQLFKIPYLWPVSNLIHHGRSLAAGLFLLIFTAVLAEKTFHAHGNPPEEVFGKVITLSHAAGNCDVCEFQLVTDTDISPVPVVADCHLAGSTTDNFVQVFCDQQYLQLGTDRGPPSL